MPTVYAHHTEKDMNLALAQPWCSIGSDGSAYAIEGPLRRGNPHPRNFGTFPRVLGVYVRERGLLRLEDAVRKMTSLNAAKLGLRDRGLLRAGQFADVTVFDPRTVIDRVDLHRAVPVQRGDRVRDRRTARCVLDHGRHTGARCRRVLRARAAVRRPRDAGSDGSSWRDFLAGQVDAPRPLYPAPPSPGGSLVRWSPRRHRRVDQNVPVRNSEPPGDPGARTRDRKRLDLLEAPRWTPSAISTPIEHADPYEDQTDPESGLAGDSRGGDGRS